MGWITCPCCGEAFKVDDINDQLIPPVDTNYKDNAFNVAEYFSGTRSWDFYRLPYWKFRDVINQKFASEDPKPEKENKTAYDRWKARRAKYFELPECRFAYGLNFCAREGSAYKELKNRLIERINNGAVDENDDYWPFSVEEEFHLINSEFQQDGFTREERNDMFTGFKKGQSAVSRILRLNVAGADKCISISTCPVGQYFPELASDETDEISAANS